MCIIAPVVDETLRPEDAGKILEELVDAQNQAHLLGLAMNVNSHEVEFIQATYQQPKEASPHYHGVSESNGAQADLEGHHKIMLLGPRLSIFLNWRPQWKQLISLTQSVHHQQSLVSLPLPHFHSPINY